MAATDTFSAHLGGLTGPYTGGAAITPHDTNELVTVTRAIYVGGAGNIKLTTSGGDTVTLTGATAGSILPVRAKLVFSTDTTATALVALY
jgi:hypothetical protein